MAWDFFSVAEDPKLWIAQLHIDVDMIRRYVNQLEIPWDRSGSASFWRTKSGLS